MSRIHEFIQVHNFDAASCAANRIRDAVKKLPEYPLIGRPVHDIVSPLMSDIFITFGQSGYLLRYTIIDNAIIIDRIWHERFWKTDRLQPPDTASLLVLQRYVMSPT